MVDLQVGGNPPPPDLKLCQGKMCGVSCGEQIKIVKTKKLFYKTPVAGSPCTPCRTLKIRKSNESQLATRDSIKSKTAPTHSFVGSTVGHFPSAEPNHATIVALFVDEKMLRGAENFIDSLVAVFADVGNTFKRSKNFSDHIFYGLNLVDCKAHVKSENFTITVRNNFCRLETFLDSFFGDANESGGQTFAGMGKIREAVAVYCLKNQFVSHVFSFVFHGDTLAVVDDFGKNFFALFNRIFVVLVQVAPVRLVVHEFIDAAVSVVERDPESHDVVDVNFSFDFHAYSMGQNFVVVNRLFFVFHENFVLTFLAHAADFVLLDAERVAEDISPLAAGDAGSTSNGERASAAQIAEADVVECGGH